LYESTLSKNPTHYNPSHVLEEHTLKPVTLRIKPSIDGIIWLSLFLLFLFVGIAEWITRLDFFQTPMTPPKLGSRHYQLGHKLALLDTEVEKNGPIDCIMVGSSMVDVGFNPDFFQSGYEETTTQGIRCFNFGIDASSAVSTAVLVKILVEDYHPRLLIIGTDPRDYAGPREDRDPAAILETPWIQYREGYFSLDGWLTEHSHFYRYLQHLSRLLHFNFEGALWSETKLNFEILVNGYTPLTRWLTTSTILRTRRMIPTSSFIIPVFFRPIKCLTKTWKPWKTSWNTTDRGHR
jgi:hypothetical protein